MPEISVIVPVYNVEKYLNKCIDSILAQTFTDFELILVDDGSTDKSSEICDEYAKKDSRICVIHKENGGQCSARNLGIDTCRGNYITFVDSDDWIDLDYYEKMISKAKKFDLDCVVCDRKVFYENGKEVYNTNFTSDTHYKINNLTEHLIKKFFLYTPVVYNRLYRRDCLANIRFKDIKYCGSEDFVFNYELIFNIKSIGEVPNTYYNNLANLGSTARRYEIGEMLRNVNLYRLCTEIAEKNNSNDEKMQSFLLYTFHYFFSRGIHQIKNFCNDNHITALKNEISNSKKEIKKLSILFLKNSKVKETFKFYGFKRRGILLVKIQYFLLKFSLYKLFILYCKFSYSIK